MLQQTFGQHPAYSIVDLSASIPLHTMSLWSYHPLPDLPEDLWKLIIAELILSEISACVKDTQRSVRTNLLLESILRAFCSHALLLLLVRFAHFSLQFYHHNLQRQYMLHCGIVAAHLYEIVYASPFRRLAKTCTFWRYRAWNYCTMLFLYHHNGIVLDSNFFNFVAEHCTSLQSFCAAFNRALQVRKDIVTVPQFERLFDLTTLRCLELPCIPDYVFSIEKISKLTRLDELLVSDLENMESLVGITSLSSLTRLQFCISFNRSASIPFAAVHTLQGVPNLKRLRFDASLSPPQVGSSGWAVFESFTSLTHLHVPWESDLVIPHLAQLTALRCLVLKGIRMVTRDHIAQLSTLTNLTKLNCSGCHLPREAVELVVNQFTDLRVLNVSFSDIAGSHLPIA
jgi:hypothetical protein